MRKLRHPSEVLFPSLNKLQKRRTHVNEFTANFSIEVHRQPHLHLSTHLFHSAVVIICAQLIFNQLLSWMHLPQQPCPTRQRNSRRGRRESFRLLVPLRAVTPYSNRRKSKSLLHRLTLHNNQTSSNNPIYSLTNYQMDENTGPSQRGYFARRLETLFESTWVGP